MEAAEDFFSDFAEVEGSAPVVSEPTVVEVEKPEESSEKPAEVEKPAEEKAEEVEKPEGEEPSPELSVEEKAEERIAVLEKQVKDTQNWATQNNQKYTALQNEIRQGNLITQQKLDGTYVEPTAPSAEQMAGQASQLQRVNTSMAAAIQVHGKDVIFEKIEKEGSPVRQLIESDPQAANRIFSAPLPYMEALNILEERELLQEYGGNSLKELVENIKKNTLDSQTEELTKSITAKIMENLNSENKQPGSLRGARQTDPANNKTTGEIDFFASEY